MTWDPIDAQWERNFALLSKYRARERGRTATCGGLALRSQATPDPPESWAALPPPQTPWGEPKKYRFGPFIPLFDL